MDIKKIFNKRFWFFLALIFLAEILSLSAYLSPELNNLAFLLVSLIVLVFSIRKLEYGAIFLLIEIFIGSKGYLFSFNYDGTIISIRMAIWIIILGIWFFRYAKRASYNKKIGIKELSKFKYSKAYIVLAFFVLIGFVNGLINNSFSDFFFDFNSWLYFLLIFPLYSIFKKNTDFFDKFIQVLTVSSLWISIKTFLLLFVLSHKLPTLSFFLYKWVRVTGVGEITKVLDNFYRIFFQSHIFILFTLFIFLFLFNKAMVNKEKKDRWITFLFSSILLSTIFISFSRSFWVGLVFGVLIFISVIIRRYNFKKSLITSLLLIPMIILSISIIFAVVKFPYPETSSSFNPFSLLSNRANLSGNEAAISSRWSLLPVLFNEIQEKPVLGKGFGETVTYETSDPRILELTGNNIYTTYAFEWGWLDLWLKIGFFGALVYLILMIKIFFSGLKLGGDVLAGLAIGIASLLVINIFTPYLNHPLGIMFIILVSLSINQKSKEKI